MKNLNRVRIAIAASAALVLTAMSSAASAQPTREEYCQNVAWQNCSWVNGQPTHVTVECYYAEYDACFYGYAAEAVKKPAVGDRRSEVQMASRTAAASRL